jgi:hypothetical protein
MVVVLPNKGIQRTRKSGTGDAWRWAVETAKRVWLEGGVIV